MLKVYKECCGNCLLSKDAIVSPSRVRQIIKSCKDEQTHFICHKSEDVVCNKFFNELGHYSQLIRIAERLNVIKFVEQKDNEKLAPYRLLNKRR